jgi:hypothetical protein
MRVGENKCLVLLLWFGVVWCWLPVTECFVRMRPTSISSSVWQRRIWSATTSAGSRLGSSSQNHGGQRFVALAHNNNNAQSYFTRHSRLFATSSAHMGATNESTPPSSNKDDENQYTDYEKWVRRLYMTNLFHPVKMGLTNMRELHDLMGTPMDDVSYCTFLRWSSSEMLYRLTCILLQFFS